MRVYTLARELGIDAKSLMKLCGELEIAFKSSSALAIIADEDAVRVREYVAGRAGKKGRASSSTTTAVPEPPRQVVTGRIPTIQSRPKRSAAAEMAEPAEMEKTVGSVETSVTEPVSVDEPIETGETTSAAVSETPTTETAAPETPTIEVAVSETPTDEKTKTMPETLTAKPETKSKTAKTSTKTAEKGETETVVEPETKAPKRSTKKTSEVTEPMTEEKTEKPSGARTKREKRSDVGKLGRKKDGGESRPLSVAESIALQGAEMSAPVRPDTAAPTAFPPLYNVRTNRSMDASRAEQGKKGKDAEQEHSERMREDRRPNIRLAPLPDEKMPQQRKAEPKAQKPDFKLSPEAIQAGLAGDDSLLQKAEQDLIHRRGRDDRKERSSRDRDGGRVRDRGERSDRGDRGPRGERSSDRGPRGDRTGDRTSDRTGVGRVRGPEGGFSSDRRRGADDRGMRGGSRLPDTTVTSGHGVPRKGKHRGEGGDDSDNARESRFAGRLRRGGSLLDRNQNDDEPTFVRRRKMVRTGANTAAPRKGNYVLQLPLTVRSFSEELGIPAAKVIGKLLELGTMTTITANLDEEVALLLADEFGVPVEIRPEVTLEEKLISAFEEDDEDENCVPRPPIVTFLGHVDHGKTSLLDRIINIDVVSGEKGGITQHIRAYNVKHGKQSITFVDTPGHEAFTEMRARGAQCTDIAVLVVAADDGVMPQTEEAISHAKAAGVPIVVALNKIDLPGVNEPRILQELATNGLTPGEWGGDTEVIRCSALTGQGIDELMETILMVAELNNYRANPDRPASGICIEASVQQGRGVIAKLLVQNGTLRPGDVVVCGPTYGKIKVMADTLQPRVRFTEAGPAIPVNALGLDEVPGAGDKFYVLENIADARRLAEERAEELRVSQLSGGRKAHVTLEGLFEKLGSQEVQTLSVILRADVRGSIEAIRKELGKLEHEEVQVEILQASVGGITEADVQLADASDAIIVGFNVVPDEKARALAESKGVQVRQYDIIYQLTADIKAALEGMLKPEEREKEMGRMLVQRTFQISHVGTVAGCRVLSGTVTRDCSVRIVRDSRIIGTYPIDTLKREKDNVKEVREGYECGIRLAGFNDIKDGDILAAYQVESVARTFDD